MATDAELYSALKYRVVVEPDTGTRRYYNSANQLHSDVGPAIVYTDGTSAWYQNGRLHREDGPAVIFPRGRKEWYRNGLRHRDAGPAVEHMDGTRMWLLYGRLHRTNGPAIEWSDGSKEWWVDGVNYTERDYYLQLKALGFNT
jgi:hypothetical protein